MGPRFAVGISVLVFIGVIHAEASPELKQLQEQVAALQKTVLALQSRVEQLEGGARPASDWLVCGSRASRMRRRSCAH